MAAIYLRVEGVNLSSTLDDTSQVSVARGASYMLREVTQNLPTLVNENFKLSLEIVSVGASVGLYRCDCDDKHLLVRNVEHLLMNDPGYQHFSFVASAIEVSNDFRTDLEKLIAANRWKQMQLPSFSLAGLNSDSPGPCAWNSIRPAEIQQESRKIWRDHKSLMVSNSVAARYHAGRELRQAFYCKEAGDEFKDLNFTDDLHELATNPAKGNLDGKIAVFYLDGNRFGKLQRKYCTSEASQKSFDKTIQQQRRTYLANFLRYVQTNQNYLTIDKKTKQTRIRLEILMWGGDEILMVVPAWCGLDTLTFFFKESKPWTFDTKSKKGRSVKEPLTHAAGLVFSQYKTPLARLVNLVKYELAENAKAHLKEHSRNGFDYAVLESIDYPTEALETFRNKVFGQKINQAHVPLSPFNTEALIVLSDKLKQLPRGQLYALARAIVNSEGMEGPAVPALSRLKEVTATADLHSLESTASDVLRSMQGDEICEAWRWLHLVELWDYLPTSEESVTKANSEGEPLA